jgi:hypothetical protein
MIAIERAFPGCGYFNADEAIRRSLKNVTAMFAEARYDNGL